MKLYDCLEVIGTHAKARKQAMDSIAVAEVLGEPVDIVSALLCILYQRGWVKRITLVRRVGSRGTVRWTRGYYDAKRVAPERKPVRSEPPTPFTLGDHW